MKILFITPSSPFDKSFGGGQRSAHMYDALLKHGHVEVLILKEGTVFGATRGGVNGEPPTITYHSSSWRDKYKAHPDVAQWINENFEVDGYDIIVGRYLTAMCIAGVESTVPQLVDVDDAYYTYMPSTRTLQGRVAALGKSLVRRYLTKRAMRRFDYVWVASAMDLVAFPVKSGGVLPNIPNQASPILAPPKHGNDILFVGAMWYGPNRDAVDWFIDNCWAAIRTMIPSATFTIVGGCSTELIAEWNEIPGVKALGFVDDLAAQYRQARFTVSPIRFGGGTQIKVLESLGFGRTSVVSKFIHKRYADVFVSNESLLVANTADEFTRHCMLLLENPGLTSSLANVGHCIVGNLFSKEVFDKGVADGLASINRA